MPLRERFPIFQSRTYFDSCSHGALSDEVRQAYLSYLDDRDSFGSHWEVWAGKLETLRTMLAQLLNVSADEIATASCLSDCLNSLAGAVDFTGNRNGARLDIKPIIDMAHEKGALVFLDFYQAAGSRPIDLKSLDVDFAAAGTLKYLVSATGTTFLYVKENLINTLEPTTSGWFSQADINAMDIYRNDPASNARRFETGTPNVSSLYASIAGLQLVNEIGLEVTERHVRTLNRAIKQKAQENGFQLAMPADDTGHGPLVTIRATDMHGLVAALEDKGVITSCRDDNLRVSSHFYNNLEDVEVLFDALNGLREFLA